MESSKRPLRNPLSTFTFDAAVQSELSPEDAVAELAVEAIEGDLCPDADSPLNLASLFYHDIERAAWAAALNRVQDAQSLVIAWSSEPALLCPRAAYALAKFRIALEACGYQVRGFAASLHDNLGEPSLHGASWAMVLAGASPTIIQELMKQSWREVAEGVRPHRCGWCSGGD